MNELRKHEIFEIETLEGMNSAKLLDPLVFGGGTMLRLCYELNRYSADIDFWFVKKINPKVYFNKIRNFFEKNYDLTDAAIKHYTLLFEIRTQGYSKRLKIEIRKRMRECDFQDRIAFSKYSTKQVVVRVHTLEQTMKNKIEAALDRKEIRDCFDIEFLLRRGISFGVTSDKLIRLESVIRSFKDIDYKVMLGRVLENQERKYYIENKFTYLLGKIKEVGTTGDVYKK